MLAGSGDRLFATEIEFIHALAVLMEHNSQFSEIAMETILNSRAGDWRERSARADIVAVRAKSDGSKETLIIECKTRPLYGREVERAIEQVVRYGVLRPTARLVLALPGQLAAADAERVRASGIELWDLPALGAIFKAQLKLLPDAVARAFAGLVETPVTGLLKELGACEPGKNDWSVYQGLVGRILEYCFCPPLNSPLGESPDQSGVNRRDFVFANFAEAGFWNSLRVRYSADYVVVDAKNYTGKVKKKEVLQMANYLKHFGTGLFGMIVSRNGGDPSALQTVREQWAHYHKMILLLNDAHLTAMLNASGRGEAASVIAKEIQDFRLSM